jgi:hypothetical protein
MGRLKYRFCVRDKRLSLGVHCAPRAGELQPGASLRHRDRRCESDPSRDLRGALPPKKGAHFAATTDPSKLAEILRAMDGYEGGPGCAMRAARGPTRVCST